MYVIGYCGDGDGGGCGQVWFSDSREGTERIAAVRLDPPGTVRWGVRRVALARFSFVAGLLLCVFIPTLRSVSFAVVALFAPQDPVSHYFPRPTRHASDVLPIAVYLRISSLYYAISPQYIQYLLHTPTPHTQPDDDKP